MSQLSDETRRLNGAKSKGPITPEGKRNSSRNAVRHGLLAQSVIFDSESKEAFGEFLEDMFDVYEPDDVVERNLVETMAVCRWKQERMWTIETATLALEERRQLEADPDLLNTDPQTRTALAFTHLADNSRSLELLGRYQVRNDREYERAFARFRTRREKSNEQKKNENSKRTGEVAENK